MGRKCCHTRHLSQQNGNLAKRQKKALYLALVVNSVVFVCELVGGFMSQSEAVLADSIHLLSHLFVIFLSLLVLRKNIIWKARAAFVKGLLIAGLGLSIIIESLSSLFLNKNLPEAHVMSVAAMVAFVGNLLTLWLLQKHRDEDLNMRSAWACSQADLLTNIGLIATGVFVAFFSCRLAG